MTITLAESESGMGRQAAGAGASLLREALAKRGEANLVVATGASQFTVLENLVTAPGIDWSKVTGFHLDEYVGLPMDHPASFRGYLRDRFVAKLPEPMAGFHYLDGEGDAESECARVGAILVKHPVDVAFIGIGENGHIAFNDPPADFETTEPYLVVSLDEACRRQQLGEGWFPDFESVPRQAISMSVRQILASRTIVCSVPDERKAAAVAGAAHGPVTPEVPASILREHPDCRLFLDPAAASQLPE